MIDFVSWARNWLSGRSDAFNRIGEAYDKGQFGEAYSMLRDIMDGAPELYEDGDLCIIMAELEFAVNWNIERALRLLDRAREVGFSKETIRYYHTRGQVLRELGQHEAAIADLEKCVEADEDMIHLIVLAETLSFFDDSRAVGMWQRILDRDPRNCLAHVYLGRESIKVGKRSDALTEAKRAEDLASSAEDLFEIGRLYHELNQFRTAIEKFHEADRCGYKDKALLYGCVAADYLSLAEGGPASQYIERALRFDPDHHYANQVRHEYETRQAKGWLSRDSG